MAQVTLHVGGHEYKLACRDGEEERLEKLGQYLDLKAKDLQQSLGQVSETRLLLMSAILVTDEMMELRDQVDGVAPPPEMVGPTVPRVDPGHVDAVLENAISRVEALTEQL